MFAFLFNLAFFALALHTARWFIRERQYLRAGLSMLAAGVLASCAVMALAACI
jgi:hypothetical protein